MRTSTQGVTSDAYGFNNISWTTSTARGSKLFCSIDMACSKSAFAFRPVGMSFLSSVAYFAARYRQIARLSYRIKPSSSYMTKASSRVIVVHEIGVWKQDMAHNARECAKWLLLFVSGRLDIAPVQFNEFKGHVQFPQDVHHSKHVRGMRVPK